AVCHIRLPPPPPPLQIRCMEIFRFVEEMPRFPGCESLPTIAEKKQCADEKMLKFIYDNINYPALARENCVEGTVVVQFVIEKDGSITNGKIVRDIGAQCGKEALRVVNLMKKQGLKWIPGKQRGYEVRVQFHLPIRFHLDCPAEEPAPAGIEEIPETADEALPPTEVNSSGTPLKSEPEGFRLFPNPATDWINVHLQPAHGPVSLSIINTTGQVLWKQEYGNQDGTIKEQASLAQWASGTYFLHIEQPGTTYTRLFVKQR
ncbi:MAG: TonB family protein, partial [Phaeodactylibacter sp.]|nr:TonB family protein [Phaeodactylibacter sp.]